jgi:hypothetical protein
MAAEFHLAEYALALHLLLQHLERLVDIVVTDENLHAAFLLDRAVDGSDSQGARGQWRADMYNSGADGTRGTNGLRYLKSCQPMGTLAAIGGSEDFGTSPFFGSSSDKPTACPYTTKMGMPEIKGNSGHPLLCRRRRVTDLVDRDCVRSTAARQS